MRREVEEIRRKEEKRGGEGRELKGSEKKLRRSPTTVINL